MSMNIQSTLAYANYQKTYNSGKVNDKKASTAKNTEAVKKEPFISNGEKHLSKAAQKLLQTLRSSRSDMDFMVADFNKGDNAKEILSHSDKEFTVVFSSDELEKMASDEKYYEEKMNSIAGALRMSEEINTQFGFERGFDKTENMTGNATITKFGISFNSDGSSTLFAALEQSQAADAKKTTVYASTREELLEKINSVNWDMVKLSANAAGSRFDYSI